MSNQYVVVIISVILAVVLTAILKGAEKVQKNHKK
jgi:hypothetical protein